MQMIGSRLAPFGGDFLNSWSAFPLSFLCDNSGFPISSSSSSAADYIMLGTFARDWAM